MNQHAQQMSQTTTARARSTTQQISSPTELDLPQSGYEDEDEAWLTELIGSEVASMIDSESAHSIEKIVEDN